MANIQERRNKQGELISFGIRVYRGRDPHTGQQMRPYTPSWRVPEGWTETRARREARRQAVLFEKQCKDGRIPDGRQTFGEYAEYVIRAKEREGLKHRTVVLYQELLERIRPVLGPLKLRDIRPGHLNAFYEHLAEEGMRRKEEKYRPKRDFAQLLYAQGETKKGFAARAGISFKSVQNLCNGPGVGERVARQAAQALDLPMSQLYDRVPDARCLSATTIRQHHQFISCVFSEAEREMLVLYNPASRARPPRPEPAKPRYFEVEEVRLIRQAIRREPLQVRVLVHLLLVTGCRRGEVLGLRWQSIDWKGEALVVDRAILYTPDAGVYADSPKTASSVRTVTLPEETMALLRRYRGEKRRMGRGGGEDYLFSDPEGNPLCPERVGYLLRKLSQRYGLPPMNAHAFRHTQASVLFFQGVDSVTISKRLGHSRVSTTTDIYSHLLEHSDERASQCVAEALLK